METRANYVVVGAFTLLVFLAAFAFVYWVARVDTGGDNAQLNIVIDGSVTGLSNSSPVKFNGIDVGRVTRLDLDPNNPDLVIAEAQVRRDLPITEQTSAVLSFTGLTGIAHISLEGGNVDAPNVFALADQSGETATIRADVSAVTDLLATAQDIADRADSILADVEGFVADARGPITEVVQNVTEISEALAGNAGQVDQFLTGMGELGGSLETVAVSLERTLAGVDELIAAVEPGAVTGIVEDVETFTNNLGAASNQFEDLVASTQIAIEALETVVTRVDQSFDQVDTILGAVDPADVETALGGLADAGQAISTVSEDVVAVAGALEGRVEDIQTIFDNVTEMSERLNAASVRVDGVLERIGDFVGEGDGAGSLIADAGETLQSFQAVADNLNARLDGIADGLERFSDRGLRDVESLITDTRRSISRIEQAITSLERDPQRLLFGGEGGGVKRFDGRERR